MFAEGGQEEAEIIIFFKRWKYYSISMQMILNYGSSVVGGRDAVEGLNW